MKLRTRRLPQIAGMLAVAVSCVGGMALEVKAAGTPMSWGHNGNGQVGDGTTTPRSTPVQVSGLSQVIAIAGANTFSLAVANDGTVWAWGYNGSGQLGDGSTTDRHSPVQVNNLVGVKAVAGGSEHSLALLNDGTVWSWGGNGSGALGNGTTTDSTTPVQVSNLSGVTAIAAGLDHSIALLADGTVWTWGNNAAGALGDGSGTYQTTPVQVTGLTGVTAISAGHFRCMTLKSNGTVWGWGYNAYGQVGDGTQIDRDTPVQVSGLTGVSAIASGAYESFALKTDGTVKSWGYNFHGELGDGTNTDRITPVSVSGLTGITMISCFSDGGVALKNNGTVWGWGYNGAGAVGDGTTTDRYSPVQITALSGVSALAGGGGQNLALIDNNPPTVSNISDQTIFANNNTGALNFTVGDVETAAGSLTLNGTSSNTTLVPNGNISFGGSGASRTVTVTPAASLTGSATITIKVTDGGGLFTAMSFDLVVTTGPTYNISGNVKDQGNSNLSGVTITLSPAPAGGNSPTTTDGSGNYTLTGVPAGSYTITASKTNYGFLPASNSATVTSSNVTGKNFVGYNYTLNGRVAWSDGVGIQDVAIHLNNGRVGYTNSAGYYTFTGVVPAAYTITPVLATYTFLPGYLSATVSTATVSGKDFVGGYAIHGRLANSSGVGIAGVTVSRTGWAYTVTSNGAGYYSFYGVKPDTYTVTPDAVSSGYGWAPENRSVTVSTGQSVANNFTGTTAYRIIGRVQTSGGVGIQNVSVSRGGGYLPVLTNSAGYYILYGVPNGTYTVTPTLTGYTFSPTSKSVTVNNADQNPHNFIGTP